jgi:hypothetical protein
MGYMPGKQNGAKSERGQFNRIAVILARHRSGLGTETPAAVSKASTDSQYEEFWSSMTQQDNAISLVQIDSEMAPPRLKDLANSLASQKRQILFVTSTSTNAMTAYVLGAIPSAEIRDTLLNKIRDEAFAIAEMTRLVKAYGNDVSSGFALSVSSNLLSLAKEFDKEVNKCAVIILPEAAKNAQNALANFANGKFATEACHTYRM